MIYIAYVLSIIIVNIAFLVLPIVNVGIGDVPAAAFLVAIPLTLRDFIHRAKGPKVALVCVLVAAGFTALFSPKLALASTAGFLIGELLDMLIFQKIQNRGMVVAVGASNVFGAFVDSVVFLLIAFGSLAFLPGQMLAKIIATVVAVLIVWIIESEILFRRSRPGMA